MISQPLKIIFIGTSGVGKTSIIRARFDPHYSGSAPPTIGNDLVQGVVTGFAKEVHVQVWDTAGAEQYLALTPRYYRGAGAIVFVFDVTSDRTLNQLDLFLPSVNEIAPDALRFLVGNKCDLEERFPGFTQKVDTFAGKIKAEHQHLTSTITRQGIEDLFVAIVNTHENQPVADPPTRDARTIDIAGTDEKRPDDEKGCC
jgi:small GTP-binding protein